MNQNYTKYSIAEGYCESLLHLNLPNHNTELLLQIQTNKIICEISWENRRENKLNNNNKQLHKNKTNSNQINYIFYQNYFKINTFYLNFFLCLFFLNQNQSPLSHKTLKTNDNIYIHTRTQHANPNRLFILIHQKILMF